MAERAGISDGFVYAPKPAAAPAANIRVSLPPHNKDRFDFGNETVMFNIPCGKRGQYLNTRMSYLTFDLDVKLLQANDFPVVVLDGGAHALFQSLELYHGTNLLEQVREYNNLYGLMMDMQENNTGAHVRGVSEGTRKLITPIALTDEQLSRHKRYARPVLSGTTTVGSAPVEVIWQRTTARSQSDQNLLPLYGVKSKQVNDMFTIEEETVRSASNMAEATQLTNLFPNVIGVVFGAKAVTYSFAIPIMSGVIGGGMGKYIPVGALQSDLRLELGIAPWAQALRTVGVVTADGKFDCTPSAIYGARTAVIGKTHQISMRNIELQLEYIEVASDVQSAIEASTGGQYIMSFESFFNIQNAVPAGAGAFTQLIGAKFSSVKTIISTFRDGLSQAYHHLSSLSRVNPFSLLPNRPEFSLSGGNEAHVSTELFNTSQYANGSGWYYSIGATHYPPKPIRSDEESWYEALKSQHLVAMQQMPGKIDGRSWAVSARRDVGDNATLDASNTWMQHPMPDGKFFLAQNFESQSHKSHLAESGVNTLAQNMYVHARFPGNARIFDVDAYPLGRPSDKTYVPMPTGRITGQDSDGDPTGIVETKTTWTQGNQQLLVDHYVHYDGLLLIVNGIANTRF